MAASAAKTVICWTDHSGNDHDGPLVTRVHDYDVIACEVCGFRHVIPLPSPADLERAYSDAYYSEEKPTFLAHAGEDQEWASLSQRDRLECFESLLPANRRQLLDIGSGPGFFLKSAASRGWYRAWSRRDHQAVADTGLGLQVLGASGVTLQLAAELGDIDTQILGLFGVLGTPDFVQQLSLR